MMMIVDKMMMMIVDKIVMLETFLILRFFDLGKLDCKIFKVRSNELVV